MSLAHELSVFVQGNESAENRSFKIHYAELFDAIQNPVCLSTCLYSIDLLSRNTRNKIYELGLTEQKVSVLLDATETTIRLKPQNFYKFVEVLEMHSSMQDLCGKLRHTCGECDNYLCLCLSYMHTNSSIHVTKCAIISVPISHDHRCIR